MHDKNIPSQNCPRCGYHQDSANDFMHPAAQPSPGDVSICLNCGDLLVFDDKLVLKIPEDEVEIYLSASSEQLRLITASQSFIKTRGPIKK